MSVVQSTITDGVGRITLNRPERMNAITTELARGLEHALNALSGEAAVNVVVIRGAGKNFCAGGDVAEVEDLRSAGPQALRTLFDAFRRACDVIAMIEVPVVAAVEGVAMAGGFELMQAADIVLVSDDAKIADNHINFGMIPGGGSTQRLPRLVGHQIALGLLLSGDRLSGPEAVRLGLAYRSFAAQDFNEGVDRFVSDLAGRDRSALVAIKKLVGGARPRPPAQGLDDEITAVVAHITRHGVDDFSRIGTS
ncbi:MAG TPA: enoyl-CoA hydratase/isomerase family protein [Mycobacterium sp.]|nr:enoyl-CoA hydratase/isomerase family protein [Mycobacterium sp.]